MLKTQNYIHVTKYYKKIIVSRSLIHCIYIHVYVYLYDIMLRIFANSMCTWLLYETFFFISFMIKVTDAFFKNHVIIIYIFMVACTRYVCHSNFQKNLCNNISPSLHCIINANLSKLLLSIGGFHGIPNNI